MRELLLNYGLFAMNYIVTVYIIYLFIMTLAGVYAAFRQRKPYLIYGLPLMISVMHISWGSGFLWSILNLSKRMNG